MKRLKKNIDMKKLLYILLFLPLIARPQIKGIEGITGIEGIGYTKTGITYNPLAVAYFARMTEEPSDSMKFILSMIYDSLDYWNIIDSCDGIWPLDLHTAQASCLDMCDTNNATLVNSPAFEPYGGGITGDGISSCVNTNLCLGTETKLYTRNSAHVSYYCSTNLRTDGHRLYGTSVGTAISYMRINGDFMTLRLNGGNEDFAHGGDISGHYVFTRLNNITVEMSKNGGIYDSQGNGSISLAAGDMYILCENDDGTPEDFDNNQLSWFTVGSDFTQEQASAIYRIVKFYKEYWGQYP